MVSVHRRPRRSARRSPVRSCCPPSGRNRQCRLAALGLRFSASVSYWLPAIPNLLPALCLLALSSARAVSPPAVLIVKNRNPPSMNSSTSFLEGVRYLSSRPATVTDYFHGSVVRPFISVNRVQELRGHLAVLQAGSARRHAWRGPRFLVRQDTADWRHPAPAGRQREGLDAARERRSMRLPSPGSIS